MSSSPVMLASDIHRRSRYGAKHPLAIPRVSTVVDLSRALGWLPDGTYRDAPVAHPLDLLRFHDPDYVEAVQRAEAKQSLDAEERQRYNLGIRGNPIFGEVYRRPATAVGASLLAAGMLREGGVVHSPAGGTHHARRARAEGFCFFNDPVLGILRMLDLGMERIAYVDIDAHHGDGVEEAFVADDRVLTISVHENGRWPFTGAVDDHAGRAVRNLPMPQDLNDDEMSFVLEEAVLPLLAGFRPEAIVLQCGADSLAEDPLSRLGLSNEVYVRTVQRVRELAPRLLVLGGGGYNPWALARCWTRIWGALAGFEEPDRLPEEAETVMRGLTWHRAAGRNPPEYWFTTLADAPRNGPVRDEVRDVVLRARKT